MKPLWKALAGTFDLAVAPAFGRPGFEVRSQTWRADALPADLNGAVIVVTGANAGIGRAITTALVGLNAHVVMVCRNAERAEQARLDIAQDAGVDPERMTVRIADMADLSAVAAVCERIRSEWPALRALVLNAGALVDDRQFSADGLELTFGVHVAAPHLMVRLLQSSLAASSSGASGGIGRVVFVASGGMYGQRLDVDTLERGAERFDGVKAYANAKRAQVVLARRWAARLAPDVVVASMHPGWVDTDGVRTALPRFHRVTEGFLRTPAQGADTAVWLAAGETHTMNAGSFYLDRVPRTEHLPGMRTRVAKAKEDALWMLCDRVTARFSVGGNGVA